MISKNSDDKRLSALCLPGIQDHPDDWQEFAGHAANFIEVMHAETSIKAREMECNEWLEKTINAESEIIRMHAFDILIAHSYADHRALTILERNPSLRAGILINPPRNQLLLTEETSKLAGQIRNVQTLESVAQQLMWSLTFDMSDKVFEEFTARYDLPEKNRREHKKELSQKFGFLKNGMQFEDRLSQYSGKAPLLILQSPFDPWHISKPLIHPLATTQQFRNETGHYPHVSKPSEVSEMIRQWLFEKGILKTIGSENHASTAA